MHCRYFPGIYSIKKGAIQFCFRPILVLQRHSEMAEQSDPEMATDSKLSQFSVISINRMGVERFTK